MQKRVRESETEIEGKNHTTTAFGDLIRITDSLLSLARCVLLVVVVAEDFVGCTESSIHAPQQVPPSSSTQGVLLRFYESPRAQALGAHSSRHA